jgi:hypothetical protein
MEDAAKRRLPANKSQHRSEAPRSNSGSCVSRSVTEQQSTSRCISRCSEHQRLRCIRSLWLQALEEVRTAHCDELSISLDHTEPEQASTMNSFIGGALAAILLLPAPSAMAGEAPGSSTLFGGLRFGIGLGVTIDTGSRDRVEEAIVDTNGYVRVNETSNINARFLLETHFLGFGEKVRRSGVSSAWGPFIALQPGTDDIVEAIGLGMMYGWKRKDAEQSFNIGFGLMADPSTKVLGDEFQENRPAPTDPSGRPLPVRLQTRDQGGILLFASFSW